MVTCKSTLFILHVDIHVYILHIDIHVPLSTVNYGLELEIHVYHSNFFIRKDK